MGGLQLGGAVAMRVASQTRGSLHYAGIALVMMSNLMLELLITRIFSATMWYHFAFMAVSIALFGTTVGAVAVHLWPRHFALADAWRLAARYALAYAASIVACMVLQLRLNVTFGATWSELALLAALYVLVAVPFTLSGVFMCLVLVRAEERIGAVYSADLIGAAVGCALFVPFAAYGEGPRGVLLLAALAALGAALVAAAAADRRTGAAALLGAGTLRRGVRRTFRSDRAAGAAGPKGVPDPGACVRSVERLLAPPRRSAQHHAVWLGHGRRVFVPTTLRRATVSDH